MATKAEIRNRVANDYLGILPLGQTLQHQDKARIEEGYQEVYEYLKSQKLATWAFAASVPDILVPYVVAMVADNVKNTYGVSDDRFIRITASSAVAESEIRKIVLPEYISQEQPNDF